MIWIDTQEPLDRAMERVAAQPVVSVDTEADSLHSYFDKVCLIQISIPDEDLVIDPLRNLNLAAFGELLANADITKVLHGADYDLRILNRDFGFTASNLIDTSVAAQLLGYEAFGDRAGRPLLLMPTWQVVHMRFWRLQIPYFARHGFRVIAYDLSLIHI